MSYRKLLTRRTRRLISVSLAMTALLSYMLMQVPGRSPVIASAGRVAQKSRADNLNKDQLTARLSELDEQITAAKAQGNTALLAILGAEYEAISAQLGGDQAALIPPKSPAPSPVPGPVINVVPPAPSGCTVTTTAFNNMTVVPIPATGTPTVTSTINVSGVGTYLYDLDMTTFIQHTFNTDLDITIQSPAGTIVTLTTDNGGGNDNVFNGTVWDDDANPAGQVPYTSNNGVVSDHVYANNVLASPLVPEEAFGAFIGENPNGTWTLTISDDTNLDGGQLTSWNLSVSTLSAAPTTAMATFNNMTAVPIPPTAPPIVVTSTINVMGAGTSLLDVNLTTFIQHTFSADLDVTIQSPAGTIVTLTTDNGGGNDNVFNGTVWDDDANPAGQVPYVNNNGLATDHTYANNVLASPLVPEEAMGAFIGENPNGTWTLTISDDANLDGGQLTSWSLTITTGLCVVGECTQIICPANITVSNTPGLCSAVVNYTPPVDPACGTITCMPGPGSIFPVGTTTVTCTSSVGPSCTFTVTVLDVEDPVITCPANIKAVTPNPRDLCVPVSFTATATDNCPLPPNAIQCIPPSGTCLPVGTTTVTCTVTDASGNTATCSFTVSAFDILLQDDSDQRIELLINSFTGDYCFCCPRLPIGQSPLNGRGTVRFSGSTVTLTHNTVTLPFRVQATVSVSSFPGTGTATLKRGPAETLCIIQDRNIRDNQPVLCGNAPPAPTGSRK